MTCSKKNQPPPPYGPFGPSPPPTGPSGPQPPPLRALRALHISSTRASLALPFVPGDSPGFPPQK